MRHSFLYLFIILLFCLEDNLYAQDTSSTETHWIKALSQCKVNILKEAGKHPEINKIRYIATEGEPGLPISISLSGVDQLVLRTFRNRDSQWDYSVWAEARLITKDGRTVWLQDLKPTVAFGAFDQVNEPIQKNNVQIGSSSYSHAMACHADGLLVYLLEKDKYNRFEAVIGIEEGSKTKNSSALFTVSTVYPEKYMEELERSYPRETGLYFSELMKQKINWTDFLTTPNSDIEQSVVENIVDKINDGQAKLREKILTLNHITDLEKRIEAYLEVYLEVKTTYEKQRDKETLYSFAFLTDVHLMLKDYRNSKVGFNKALDHLNFQKYDFVFFNGDNMARDGLPEKEAEALMREFKTIVDTKISKPTYFAVGNHDVTYIPENPLDTARVMLFERVFNTNAYYSFNHKGVHYIVLNSNESDTNKYGEYIVKQEQINWLKEDLRQTGQEKPIIVFTHVPFLSMYYPAVEGTIKSLDVFANFKEVWDMLIEYNVQVIFQGHQHIYEEIKVRDTQFVTGGSVCGNWWLPGDSFVDTYRGYILVRVGHDYSITWEYINF